MPTNLPPEYFEVEKRYKAARSPAEKAETLEELIGTIPKHKGTDKLRADLRRRLAKLKDSAAQSKKGTSRQESAYHIDKEGAGQVVVIGAPNVGKSALVRAVTNATPEVADFPFTTWAPTPGMMPYENTQFQLIDTPPLNRDYVEPDLMDLIKRPVSMSENLHCVIFHPQTLEAWVAVAAPDGSPACNQRYYHYRLPAAKAVVADGGKE